MHRLLTFGLIIQIAILSHKVEKLEESVDKFESDIRRLHDSDEGLLDMHYRQRIELWRDLREVKQAVEEADRGASIFQLQDQVGDIQRRLRDIESKGHL